MSIQWTFIAGYLYFEVAVVIVMILPIFSPRRWHQFFKSRLFTIFRDHAAVYFYVLIGVLTLFLFDSVREMRKYSHSTDNHVHLASELKGNVKLFRAQRNFYITGFAIFLSFVIRRLVAMLITQDKLTTRASEIIIEAKNTVKLAKSTVLSNTLQLEEHSKYNAAKNQLEEMERLLKVEKKRAKELENEASQWRLKYEEMTAQLHAQMNGKGDD